MDFVMSLETSDHGGGCCGIRHLSDFWDNDSFRENFEENFGYYGSDICPKPRNARMGDKIASIQEGINDCMRDQGIAYSLRSGTQNKQVLIEVVLSQDQFKFWERALQSCGFRRKSEFVNSNTGNICRVYHLATNQPKRSLA